MSASLQVTRNVSGRCLAIVTEMVIGALVLPFNVAHLGKASYGLWMLTASITAYFSILDLGYGGALVKFVAQYRARSDARALNEILSTCFYLFSALGAVVALAAVGASIVLDRLFHLTPADAHVGRIVLLIISLQVAGAFACSVFGGVINGFQRYDLNSRTAIVTSIVAAAVNVAVLAAGYGLIALVAATTAVRLAAYWVYRANAYRVFPALTLRPALFSRARLRELTSFSVYMCVIEWARKLNYSMDAVVIAVFMNTAAVAAWSIGQRIVEVILRFTIQLSDVLFPAVVDNATATRLRRLQLILILGTRLSLATVIPLALPAILVGGPFIEAWLGPSFADSVPVLQLLAFTIIVRVGNGTATTLLKGAGRHRLIAVTNLATGIANLALSVWLVRSLGLVGVALGTLVPVTAAAILVTFPMGCRRVELPLATVIKAAVWPPLWPASIMGLFIVLTRDFAGDSLFGIGGQTVAAIGVYACTFLFFAQSPSERHLYRSKALELIAASRPDTRPVPEGA